MVRDVVCGHFNQAGVSVEVTGLVSEADGNTFASEEIWTMCFSFTFMASCFQQDVGLLGGESWKAPEGSLTSNVHEWENWEQLPKLTTLWWGGLGSFLGCPVYNN